jgi:adenylate kinase family enzyme
MNLKTIIFIGKSASGKGTQVEELGRYIEKVDERKRDIFHLESGSRFRSFINEGGYTSVLARKIADDGGLQPEFLAIWAWTGELINHLEKHNHIFIDGTPRRIKETKILDSALDFYNRLDVDVIYLSVSDEWAIDKMKKRHREDDIESSDVNNRLNWFKDEVVEVIDYYRSHRSYNFHEINGEQNIEEVHRDILKALDLEKELDE